MLDYHFFARRALRLRNGPNIISILAEIYDTPHHMNWNQTVWALHVGFPLSGWFDFVPACSIAMLNTLSTTRSEMVASSTDTVSRVGRWLLMDSALTASRRLLPV